MSCAIQPANVDETPANDLPAAGDRTHIAALAQPIYDVLNGEMQRVKAKAPTSFRAQVIDTEKRLNILFDHLNNNDLLKPDTVESMCELAQALHQRNYEVAQVVQMEILMGKTDECGQWMVSSCRERERERVRERERESTRMTRRCANNSVHRLVSSD